MTHTPTAISKRGLAIFLFSLGSLVATAQNQAATTSSGYASDKFDGFEAVDKDDKLEQKTPSFWYSLTEKTAAEQFAYAQKLEKAGANKSARHAYEALIREWPTSPQAPISQINLANLFEQVGKYERAFDEYQYLLTFYASDCPYSEILDREFRIANLLLHNNRSMFGWILSGNDAIRERFERIVRNAPRSGIAPEAMLIIGSIRTSDNELEEAIAAYDGLLNRFPDSPQAISAVYLSAQCRHDLSMKHRYNEDRCRDSIAFLKSILTRLPNHPQKEQLKTWQKELTELLIEQNYQRAVFYDTKQRKIDAAKAAYHRFLLDFPDSKHAPQVRARLAELEKTPVSATK